MRRQKLSLRRRRPCTVKAVWNVFVDYARFVFILFCKRRAIASVRARETKPINLYIVEREMCIEAYDLWKKNYHVIIIIIISTL